MRPVRKDYVAPLGLKFALARGLQLFRAAGASGEG